MARSDNSSLPAGHSTAGRSRAVGNGHSDEATYDLLDLLHAQMLSIENVLTVTASSLEMERSLASRPTVQVALGNLYSRLSIVADRVERLADEAGASRKMMS